ncbi:hypothetical protein CR513_57591, partial [Mucuna pruriens]
MHDQYSKKIIAKGPKLGRLFPIHFLLSPSLSLPLVSCISAIVDYQRLGHPNSNVLHDMLKYDFLGNKHTPSLNVVHFDCISCKLGKSKILSFLTHHPNVTQPFDIIHSDSFFTWVYFMGLKDEAFSTFEFFYAYVQTQLSSKIKNLHYDNGGEYTSHSFQRLLQSNGIISQRSCSSTPQQNGVAERKNRHFLDVVRTLLLESHVPLRFRCETLSTTVHLMNRLSSPSLGNEFSFTRLFGYPCDYSTIHIFGCVCYVHLLPQERTKLNAQSVKCAFLAYSPHQKGFLCYDPNLRRIQQKAIETELLTLNENQAWDIVLCPSSVKPLCSKFVFSIKLHSDGFIDHYKTFAPVAKMTTMCTILALASSQSWPLHQMDVKNAFLHYELEEEVYIKLPYGVASCSYVSLNAIENQSLHSSKEKKVDCPLASKNYWKGVIIDGAGATCRLLHPKEMKTTYNREEHEPLISSCIQQNR